MEEEAVTIEWKPPLSDGGSPITEYIIEQYEYTTKKWNKISSVDNDTTTYEIENLKHDEVYQFRIIAVNEVGSSEPLESDKIHIKVTLGRQPSVTYII